MKNFISNQSNKKGFTLLEMLIVLTLVGILLSTVFAIIFVVLRQQARIYRTIETRRQGDAISNFMKEKIIRATRIKNSADVSQCAASGATYNNTAPNTQNFWIEDANIPSFRFYLLGTDLVYNEPPSAVTVPLHNSRVNVSAFLIECRMPAGGGTPIVQFTYTVTFKDSTPTPEEGNQTLTYRSKIKLR